MGKLSKMLKESGVPKELCRWNCTCDREVWYLERIGKHQDDLRSLADAVMKAESILRNDLFKPRVKNALFELDLVRDIAMNHMSEE